MHRSERFFLKVRHSAALEDLSWLWSAVRPIYDRITSITSRRGLERVINGTDRILISPEVRDLPETYEPDVWKCLMQEVQEGDTIVDVGAFRGLYAIALANRVGSAGHVIALEPDRVNFSILKKNVTLNSVGDRVETIQAAVGEKAGLVNFSSNLSESHITAASPTLPNGNDSSTVKCITLDSLLESRSIDIMKIDVEGYEEKVLTGASEILGDPDRKPRAMFIEVHPFAWQEVGTTSESLLELLSNGGYEVLSLDGQPLRVIKEYGEIVARKKAVLPQI